MLSACSLPNPGLICGGRFDRSGSVNVNSWVSSSPPSMVMNTSFQAAPGTRYRESPCRVPSAGVNGPIAGNRHLTLAAGAEPDAAFAAHVQPSFIVETDTCPQTADTRLAPEDQSGSQSMSKGTGCSFQITAPVAGSRRSMLSP